MNNKNEESYLNDLEQESLIKFNEDVIMKQAVEKVILHYIYHSGKLEAGQPVDHGKHWLYSSFTLQEATSNDEVLGKIIRTKVEAAAMLEDGFKSIEAYKREAKKEEKVKVNKAS